VKEKPPKTARKTGPGARFGGFKANAKGNNEGGTIGAKQQKEKRVRNQSSPEASEEKRENMSGNGQFNFNCRFRLARVEEEKKKARNQEGANAPRGRDQTFAIQEGKGGAGYATRFPKGEFREGCEAALDQKTLLGEVVHVVLTALIEKSAVGEKGSASTFP